MSVRRQAILGRFRAGALDRLRRVSLALLQIAEGQGGAAEAQEVARELHTIKGESRMVGLGGVSEVIHAAEERLLACGALPAAEVCAEVQQALDVVARALREELGDDGAAAQALAAASARLSRAPGAEPAPVPAEAEPPPPAEAPPSRPAEAPAARPAEAGPARAPSPEAPTRGAGGGERWVQMSSRRIDALCAQAAAFEAQFKALRALLGGIGAVSASRAAQEQLERCETVLGDLSAAAWGLRLIPVGPVFEDLARYALELARTQGKRLRTPISGGDVQIERGVLDSLGEPLLHLVRNAVDHGMEPPADRKGKDAEGTLTLRAEPAGASILITIGDDGRGVDPERVRQSAVARGLLTAERAQLLDESQVVHLLFTHGFSTRTEVSEISGRGVGLDVVREAVEAMGGSVTLRSERGRGTTFLLTVPASVSKERVLLFSGDELLYGIPARHVVEVVPLQDFAALAVTGGTALRYRKELLPLWSLSQALGVALSGEERWAMVLDVTGRRYAFTAPDLLAEEEVVRQPADALVARQSYVGASSTLSNGRLVLVLSPAGLVRRAEGRMAAGDVSAVRPRRVLLIDDSEIIREVAGRALREGGFLVSEAPEGHSGLLLLQHEGPPAAVVLDVDMPGDDGFTVLAKIRARHPNLPVLLFTSRAAPEDRRRAALLGADAYLVKTDFREAELVAAVRGIVQGRAVAPGGRDGAEPADGEGI